MRQVLQKESWWLPFKLILPPREESHKFAGRRVILPAKVAVRPQLQMLAETRLPLELLKAEQAKCGVLGTEGLKEFYPELNPIGNINQLYITLSGSDKVEIVAGG